VSVFSKRFTLPGELGTEKAAPHTRGGKSVQYLPGWTVQCINPECAARGHWLRASDSSGEFCSNCSAPLHNVPPPLGARLRVRPPPLGKYRPGGCVPARLEVTVRRVVRPDDTGNRRERPSGRSPRLSRGEPSPQTLSLCG